MKYRAVLLLATTLLTGCFAFTRRATYAPIYLSYDDLRRGIDAEEPSQITRTGKIYLMGTWVYVNEVGEGIHVIDNVDPSNPVVAAFIPIPGNVDMAIRDNILYADSWVDLVAIDVTDPTAAVEVARVTDAFPYPEAVPESVDWYPGGDVYATPDPAQGIVVGWEKTGEKLVMYDTRLVYMLEGDAGGATGRGGSMARMTLLGDWLYTLHNDSIVLVDVSTPASPQLSPESIYVGWDIETIFPHGQMLYIGAATGMHIFDASSSPSLQELGQIQHITSCDPVVVEGDRAYVTLRAGSLCGGGDNLLLIVDVADPTAPAVLAEHALDGPYGLAVSGDTLFVCDGASGLKVLDVSDPAADPLPLLTEVTGYTMYDVILSADRAMVVGPEGLYQYDTTGLAGDPPALEHLSTVVVVPPP